MSKITKTATLDTTTLVIDFQNSNFEKLKRNYQIWEYELPKNTPVKSSDYAQIHIWAKNQTDRPYYLHTHTLKLYIIYVISEQPQNINYGNISLPKKLFNDFQNTDTFQCIIKVLLSNYVHQTQEFVSNDNFYLLIDTYNSKKGNTYADVLKIKPSLRKQKNILNEITGLHELLLGDVATRMQEVEYQQRDKWKVPFEKVMINNQSSFKPLKTTNISPQKLIYEENTSKKYKTQIQFHSIENIEKHEKSRNYLLDKFSKKFLAYLQDLGFNATTKKLNLEQVEKDLSENRFFENDIFKQEIFEINVFDKRFDQTIPFQDIIDILNNTNYAINFVKSSESSCQKDANVLILMDYSIGDCENDGVLKSKVNEDGYKIVKHLDFKNSQGFCININTFKKSDKQEGGKKESWTEENFLDYSPFPKDNEGQEDRTKLKEDIKRNLDICLQQLFLKNLIINNISIFNKLPKFNTIKDFVFIHCFTKDKKRFELLCFFENDILNFENLQSQKSLQILNKLGFEDLSDLVILRQEYDEYAKFDTGDIYLMLSKNVVWEILEVPEKVLYPSEIYNVLQDRNEQKNKLDFELLPDNGIFSNDKIERYNEFLASEAPDFISFEKLIMSEKKEGYREKIFKILDIKNETKLKEALKYDGKKAGGYFTTSQGIWFDKNKLQYFVGKKDGYKFKQETGFQPRKIVVLKGNFDKNLFFPLLNVDFVKYKSFTVMPYIFNLLKMYTKIV
jgi:hypothetical protein